MNNKNKTIEVALDEALNLFRQGKSVLEIRKKYPDCKNEISKLFKAAYLVGDLRPDIEVPESALVRLLNNLAIQDLSEAKVKRSKIFLIEKNRA